MRLTESVGDYSTEHTYTVITIGNRGRRDTAIGKVWFTQEGSAESLLVVDAFREGVVDLPEGRSKDYLMREDQMDIDRLRQLMVEDGTGQTWIGDSVPGGTINLRVRKD